MKILCFLIGHRWGHSHRPLFGGTTTWTYTKSVCVRCGFIKREYTR